MFFDIDQLKNYVLSFFKSIPREDIERFIDADKNLVDGLYERLVQATSQNKLMLDFVIGFLRKEWEVLDSYLSDVDRVLHEIISIRPDLAITFAKKHRREWLEKQLKMIRDYLYKLAWET